MAENVKQQINIHSTGPSLSDSLIGETRLICRVERVLFLRKATASEMPEIIASTPKSGKAHAGVEEEAFWAVDS